MAEASSGPAPAPVSGFDVSVQICPYTIKGKKEHSEDLAKRLWSCIHAADFQEFLNQTGRAYLIKEIIHHQGEDEINIIFTIRDGKAWASFKTRFHNDLSKNINAYLDRNKRTLLTTFSRIRKDNSYVQYKVSMFDKQKTTKQAESFFVDLQNTERNVNEKTPVVKEFSETSIESAKAKEIDKVPHPVAGSTLTSISKAAHVHEDSQVAKKMVNLEPRKEQSGHSLDPTPLQDGTYIELLFSVFIPDHVSDQVSNVFLETNCEGVNNIPLRRFPQSSLWSADVAVPATRQGFKFRFKIRRQKQIVTGIIFPTVNHEHITEFTKSFQRNENDSNRRLDFLVTDDIYLQYKGYAEVCASIITSVAEVSLKQAIIDLENFQKDWKFAYGNNDILDFIENQLDYLSYKRERALCFLVFLSNLPSTYHRFVKKMIPDILGAVTCSTSHDLTRSCADKVASTLLHLYLYHESKSRKSFVGFVDIAFPLLPSYSLSKVYTEKWKGTTYQFSVDEMQDVSVLDSFQRETSHTNEDKNLLDIVFRNIELRSLVSCTNRLLKKYGMMDKMTKLSLSALCTRTKLEIIKSSKERMDRFKRLFKIWELMQLSPVSPESIEVLSQFEKSIIHVIQSTDLFCKCEYWDDILHVCVDKDASIFTQLEEQIVLIQTIASAQNMNICSSLVTILDSDKFVHLDTDAGNSLLVKWFDNIIAHHCKSHRNISSQDLCHVYRHLGKMSQTQYLKSKQDMLCPLSDKMQNILRKRTMRENIQTTPDIEKLEIPYAETEFASHMKTLIRGGHDRGGFSVNDIIKDITGCITPLRIHSRVTLGICRSLMKLSGVIESSTSEDTFLVLLECSTLWKVLFDAEGTKKEQLIKDALYSHSEKALHNVVKSIMDGTVSCRLLKTLKIVPQMKILLPTNMYDRNKVKAIITKLYSSKELVESTLKNMRNMTILLEVVCKRTGATFRTQVEVVRNRIQSDVDHITNDSIGFAELENFTEWVTEMHKDLTTVDFLLSESQMYWNAVLNRLGQNFDDWCGALMETDSGETLQIDAVEDIRWLFSSDLPPCRDDEDDSRKAIRLFVNLLCGPVLEVYKKWWGNMSKLEGTSISDVVSYFQNEADIQKEMETAKRAHITLGSNIKKALTNFEEYPQYEDRFHAIKDTLKAFKLDSTTDEIFHRAICEFDNLCKQSDDLLLRDVGEAVQILKDATKEIDDELIVIIRELVRSSSLVAFLREVLNEDLRNLIDAVEEHSEQFVCESTVSDLIDIKQFLLPVLKMDFEHNVRAFIDAFTRSYATCRVKQIPAKIRMCMDNVHSLKSLYYNVANKEENTKEVIKMINHGGVFRIYVNKRPCELSVEWKQDKKVFEYSQSRLSDLRSRALLIMNTEEKRRSSRKETRRSKLTEHLSNFSSLVDTLFAIVDKFDSLKALGHFYWCSHSTQVVKPKEAKHILDKLTNELSEWGSLLSQNREQFYFMNYISSEHLPVLQSFLERGTNGNRVFNILKYVNPNVNLTDLDTLREKYTSMTMEDNMENKLYKTGHSVQIVFETIVPMSRTFLEIERGNVKLTDTVLEGKLHISVLEQGSRSVLHTVLALHQNTTGFLPESNQLLFCNSQTTQDELCLLINRCLVIAKSALQRRLFCIVNAELLSYELQFKLTRLLQCLPREEKYLLAIVCKGRDQCTFLEWFHDNVTGIRPLTEIQLRKCFESKWPNVTTVTSDIPGLGKTETVYDIASKHSKSVKTLHVSGLFDKSKIVKLLLDLNLRPHHLLHIDIGMINDPMALDLVLFQLIVTGFVAAGTYAYAIPTDFICIEIANSINNTLIDGLSTAIHFKRRTLQWEEYTNMKTTSDVNSPLQVVCQYLNHLETHKLDNTDIYFHGSSKVLPLEKRTCIQLLQKYFSSASDMSFTLVGIFVKVLADQLKKMSASIFFRQSSINAILGDTGNHTLKSNLVQIIVEVSKEFATRSIGTCRTSQAAVVLNTRTENIEQLSTAAMLAQRVQGMIQWEESNHLVVIFHHDMQTVSALFRKITQVPATVKNLFQSQMKKSFDNLEKASVEELQRIIVRFTSKSLPQKDMLSSLALSYALTPDNLLKMILVVMRLQSNVPVVIMGETGCGKTSLVKYLSTISGIELDVLSIHAGTSEEEIISKIDNIQNVAHKNLSTRKWVFLDEINTCDHLGVITDMLCHHRYHGKTLSANISIIAACNPYRLRPRDAVHTEGLQGKIREDELSRLVYRVHPLPESLMDFVWDYGRLSDTDERRYIRTMVGNVLKSPGLSETLTELLSVSQIFTRDSEHADYSVSLRDVDRTIRLLKWFIDMLTEKECKTHVIHELEKKAVVLAMAMSYHSRICNADRRKDYRIKMASIFPKQLNIVDETHITEMINTEQNDILNRMEIPEGIARNTALRENVFVIFVSILNKIPVFIVGKPGCSKSLSMQLIRSNLRGKDSKNDFFKTLPQLFCVSFQGSESSTSDGIVKVFEKAKRYQDRNTHDNVLSVVILDEIGLAEISRFNPLKVLHGLLEPDGKKNPDVAVVGISNWALDAAKMNRALHLSRPEMDVGELYETAKSISQSLMPATQNATQVWSFDESRFLKDDVLITLKALASAFNEYNLSQRFKNFHGLRDYYSLTKYISRCTAISKSEIMESKKTDIITHGLLRNFGGLPTEMTSMMGIFQKHLETTCKMSIPVLDLIRANVQDVSCRHLMLITQGDAVIGKLDQLLKECGKEYVMMFGSQFEDDLTDDYNYRILSRIILCMEQGIALILKDLENIYGSLYDMLNQNYTVVGKKKNCRVALGPYSNPMCHVNDDFKCVVLVEEMNLDYSDPPFLNRFEKQQFRFGDLLSPEDKTNISELETLLCAVFEVPGTSFTVSNALPIYETDVLFSLLLNVKETTDKDNMGDIISLCLHRILPLVFPDAIVRASRSTLSSEQPTKVQMLTDEYFRLPLHEGLESFLTAQHTALDSTLCSELMQTNQGEELCVIFTHSSMHINIHSLLDKHNLSVEKIGAFRSEKDLTNAIDKFFENDGEFLFLQFDSRYDMQHFFLTKITVEHKKREYAKLSAEQQTHKYVYLLVHLGIGDRSESKISQIHFMSEWSIVMLDTLEKPDKSILDLKNRTLTEIISNMRPLHNFIKEQLLWAFTRIQYSHEDRHVFELEQAIEHLQSSSLLMKMIDEFVYSQVENLVEDEVNWEFNIASDEHALISAGTYIGAIESHIQDIIRKPVAVFVFKMEQEGCLESLFIQDAKSSHRQKTWEYLASNKEICNFESIPLPSGPECYSCTTPATVRKVPFGNHIMLEIEELRDDFLQMLRKVKAQSKEYVDDEENPIEIVHAVLDGYRDIITSNTHLAELDQAGYEGMIQDYFHDFCNFMTFSHSSKDIRPAESLQWAINSTITWEKETFLDSVVMLHAVYWTYTDRLDCIVKILALACTSGSEDLHIHDVISKLNSDQEQLDSYASEEENERSDEQITDMEESENSDDLTSELNMIDKLILLVGNMLLPSTHNVHAIGFEKWKHSVSRALPLIGQISSDLPMNHKLRFCSDLAAILIVPYNLDANLLTTVGDLLQQSELNDKEIFNEVFNLLKKLINDNNNIPSLKLKKIISLYMYRCIQTQSENDDIFIWFLEWIEKEDACNHNSSFLLPDFHFIGSILQIAIASQQAEDEDLFSSIQDGNNHWKSNAFCKSLQDCLSSISPNGMLFEGLSVLLVQIIQKTVFEEDDIDSSQYSVCMESLETALSMVSIDEEDNVPLIQIFSSALIRHTLDISAGIALQTEFNIEDNQAMLQNLNALLEPPTDCGDPMRYGPLLYFLRRLKQIAGLRNVQKLGEHLEISMSTVKHIEWTKDLTTVCLEFNPLEFYCSAEAVEEVEDACNKWPNSEEQLKRFCDKMATDVDKALHIERIILAIFFKRMFVPLPESAKKFVAAVCQLIPKHSLPKEHVELLPYLCGHIDFSHYLFHLNTEIEEPDPQIVSVLMHMMFITTLYGKPGHTLYDCIHKPDQFDSHPVQILKTSIAQNIREKFSCRKCPCRVIYVASTDICPSCKQKQHSTENMKVASILNGTEKHTDSLLSYLIYRLLVNGSLICSLALRLCNESKIAAIVSSSDDESNVSRTLHKLVRTDWKILCQQLNISHSDLCCLLNLFLCANKDMSLQLLIPSDSNFITKFQVFTKCCNDFLRNRHETLAEHRAEFANRRGLQNSIEHALEIDYRYTLYVPSDNVSVENLTAELSLLDQSESAFLRVALSNRQILSLPKYITDILKWHLAVVNCMSYKVRKCECTEQTIAKFLSMVDEDNSNARLKQKFGNLKIAWNILRENRELLLEISPSLPDMELMTINSCASSCLLIDKNSPIHQVLEVLISIQNNILLEAMDISRSSDYPDFSVLSCGPDAAVVRCVSVLDVTSADVISFKWTDDFLRFAQCKPNSGKGSSILYDFHKVEMEVAHELVFRKSFITNTETIPLIVFADELFRNSVTLLQRISRKLTPQVPLTMELKQGIEYKWKRNPSHTMQLLSQIGIVLSLLNKTGGDSQTSLVDYLAAWKNYVNYKSIVHLLPEPETLIKLCHVVALYEWMELRSGDEISDTLGEVFRVHVTSEIRQHFQTAKQQHSSLEIVDRVLKVFVHRNFSTNDVNVQLNRPLVKYLMDPIYWRQDIDVRNGAIDETSKEAMALQQVLSPECLVEHLYETMELIKQAIEEKQASEMRITLASAVFKEKMTTRTQPVKKRRKLVSKLIGKT
ncbi:uncharacterized protein LOC110447384 [Mizuhopecten yessoensis]|uniref:E3 ubiquitin-protein ligase n=1 Tax=Mizuhopecten yessoensis TaxID=6573 RepID=A0A210QVF9_MIZYE|nr:uncharacterized protein LOC110447384 [Mizuhopecten yessoensis]XP_021348705.1 uncharacterized protein LOC110447384 [Mizuhopecten yessoensis]XP_021348706.1 uncharacterized protein LOC110447384 [Mizuhopecten yessoensis]OWF52739.1 E3 ubiquitin-protein ligase [Mizuhopecten yessoensis]